MAGRDEVNLRGVVAMCSLALQQITVPEGSLEQTEFCRRLDEMGSALATVRTRLEVAAVLSRVPIATSGIGTSRWQPKRLTGSCQPSLILMS